MDTLSLWIPLDDSQRADATIAACLALFAREAGSFPAGTSIRLIQVVDPHDSDEALTLRTETASRQLDDHANQLRSRGANVDCRVRLGAHPGQTLSEDMRESNPSLAIMASRAREGVARMALGSVTEAVVRDSIAPVLVLPTQASPERVEHKPIVVALDGSERAERVLPLATNLARWLDTSLVLMRSSQPEPASLPAQAVVSPVFSVKLNPEADREREARLYLQALEAELIEAGLRVKTHVSAEAPADAILQASVTFDAGVIALTTHGHSGLTRLLMGSIAESVLRTSSHPLLVVRTGELNPGPVPKKRLATLA